jgi:hypothetical protein
MKNAWSFSFAMTVVVAAAVCMVALTPGLNVSEWFGVLQTAGTVCALVWTAYQSYQQQHSSDRDSLLQMFALVRPDLEELSREIAIAFYEFKNGAASDYLEDFRNGHRSVYVKLITAKGGRLLRKMRKDQKNKSRLAALDRRLRAYLSIFGTVLAFAERREDPEMLAVVKLSAVGRAYKAISAAMLTSDEEAEIIHKELEAFDSSQHDLDEGRPASTGSSGPQ